MKKLLIVMIALVGTLLVFLLTNRKSSDSQNSGDANSTHVSLWHAQKIPYSNSQDVIGETLSNLNKTFEVLSTEAREDAKMIELIVNYNNSAVPADELRKNFESLRGKNLDFIGMYHTGIGVEDSIISNIQTSVAEIVLRDYDVMWAEDFSGARIINKENSWEEVRDEFLESGIPELMKHANKWSIQKMERDNLHLHAPNQILWKTKTSVVVKGADYRPIKAIQQRLMSYPMLNDLPPRNSKVSPDHIPEIMRTLSDARDLYILRYISQNIQPGKREVIVLGAFHAPHILRIMANFDIKGGVRTCKNVFKDYRKEEQADFWKVTLE